DATVFLRNPPDGSVYRLTSDVPADAQKIPIVAETALTGTRLRIWADGALLAECPAPNCTAWWPLSPGEHRFWADLVGEDKNTISSPRIQVFVEKSH
ncbi:MAG: hypothetical protein GXO56_01635, partial [Chloroflexi bacterium]|nr:hypothetical protein [Chloroflexota bacterium]